MPLTGNRKTRTAIKKSEPDANAGPLYLIQVLPLLAFLFPALLLQGFLRLGSIVNFLFVLVFCHNKLSFDNGIRISGSFYGINFIDRVLLFMRSRFVNEFRSLNEEKERDAIQGPQARGNHQVRVTQSASATLQRLLGLVQH